MDENEAQSGQGAANPQGEQPQQNQTMESLLESESLSVELPQVGEIRKGMIASIGASQILVSVGAKSEGVVAGRELEQLTAEERAELKVGQEVNVYVLNPEDQNGNVVLSFKRAQEEMSWENVEKMIADETVIDTKIIGFNKGGLIVAVGNLRGFVPSSQISATRRAQSTGDTPEQRWQKMVGQPISVRIIEVDRERRRLILSERSTNTESRSSMKDRVISELEEGKVYTGHVTSLADFGAFVNINGADGLVHLSELSWDRLQHPKEILEVGQEVKVKVINIDREKKRIGLSMRALQDDPWKSRVEKFSVGQLVEGVDHPPHQVWRICPSRRRYRRSHPHLRVKREPCRTSQGSSQGRRCQDLARHPHRWRAASHRPQPSQSGLSRFRRQGFQNAHTGIS